MRRLLAARHGESELSAKALVNGDPGVACPLTDPVPTRVSGKASCRLPSGAVQTTWARYSRLTWWQIPVPGGTTRKSSKAAAPQRRNA